MARGMAMGNGEMIGKTDIKRWLREVMIVLLTMTALAIAVNAWRPDGLRQNARFNPGHFH